MPINGTPGLPSMVEGASAVVQGKRLAHKAAWPYPWVYPPADSQHVWRNTVVAAPANAVTTVLLEYPVPDGSMFRLSEIVLNYDGVAFIPPGSGNGTLVWTVDVDRPVTLLAPPSLPSGYVVRDFGNIQVPLGSRERPYPIPGKLVFEPRNVVRVKVVTTAPFPAGGSPVTFFTMFLGWTYPVDRPDY